MKKNIIRDGIRPNGIFKLRVFIGDLLVEEYEDANLVVDLGKQNTALLLGGDANGKAITKIQMGTSGTAPALTDTAITNAFTKNIATVSYPTSNQVQFDWTILSNEANGMTIVEFGLVNDNSVLFARKVRTSPIQKISPMVIVGSWLITVNS